MDKYCCQPHHVVQDFYEQMFAFILKKVKDKELAKDITQELMGRMIDAYDKKTDINNIKAWLFRVSKNIIADYYKENNQKAELIDDFKNVTDFDESPLSTEDFIIPMLQLIPEKYSQALYLSDIENMKQVDIAQKLDISLSAVKMRCQRARKMLHELFLECCDIEYDKNGNFAHCTIKKTCSPLIHEEKKLKDSHKSK